MDRSTYYQRFLGLLFVLWMAGTATLLWLVGFYMALAYTAGFASPLIFAWKYPTWNGADGDDRESIIGVQ